MFKLTNTGNSNGYFSGEMDQDFKSLKTTLQSPLTGLKTLLNIICYLLDIRDGFLDEVDSFEEDIREHQSLYGWLLIFLENSYEEIEDTSLKGNLSEKLLVKIGFKESSNAVKTILKRSKLVLNHVDPIDAVKRFVLDEFKYHPLLSIMYSPSDEGLDSKLEWNSVQVLNVPGVNISDDGGTIIEDDSSRLLFSLHLSMFCTDELHTTVLYHGTDLQSANDICTDGIDVICGFRRRDFSNGTGFYLTTSYVHARDWAFSKTQKPVVLKFIIPNAFLKQAKSLDLKDESKQSQWQEIVTQNRAGEPTKEMYGFSKKYDFIEGPISISVCTPERTTERTTVICQQQPREAKLQSHQLCVISDDFADEISNHLVTIITYDEL